MKVLHVAEMSRGGTGAYLCELLAQQRSVLGADSIGLLVPADDQEALSAHDLGMLRTFAPERSFRGLLRFARALRDCVRVFRPDLVHAHGTLAGLCARVPGALLGHRFKVVYCAHGWSFLRVRPRWSNAAAACVERVLARRAHAIINISEHERRAAQAWGIRAGCTVSIPHGIAPEPPPARACVPGDLRLYPRTFLFVGRFDEQKGLDILLEAMSRIECADVHLYVIGAPVLSDFDASDTRNVTFLGWKPRHFLSAYYRAVDALVIPSRWEGFGLVAIEAMRSETAVIAADCGGLPEIVRPAQTGILFARGDVSELTRLLTMVPKQDLAAMGRAGRKRFLEHYTSQRMSDAVLEVYRLVMEQP